MTADYSWVFTYVRHLLLMKQTKQLHKPVTDQVIVHTS